MNGFIYHIVAVYKALRLVESAGAEAAVARAAWHICLANGSVAWGWGLDRDEQNELFALILRAARKRLLAVATEKGVYEAYQSRWLLWNHWRLPGQAPEVAGLPSYNLHWGEGK